MTEDEIKELLEGVPQEYKRLLGKVLPEPWRTNADDCF
jgi:hypothetical protein